MRPFMTLVMALALVLLGCGGDDTGEAPTTTAPTIPPTTTIPASPPTAQHAVGGDLLLAMQPGEGHGELAEQLAAGLATGSGGVKEGTANHIAWYDREVGGPVHIVTYTPGRIDPRWPDPEAPCVMFGGSGHCGVTLREPMIYDWGGGPTGDLVASAYGGESAAEAVFRTESAKTVSVLAIGGYAYAEWPKEWGQPETLEFYDTAGEPVTKFEFPVED